jgi:hypothetical protein
MSDEHAKESVLGWGVGLVLLAAALTAGAIGIIKFIQARNVSAKASCISNLKQIDGAVQQWALENMKTATDTYSLSDPALLAYLRGSVLPMCPSGGRYRAGGVVTNAPRCSVGGPQHSID